MEGLSILAKRLQELRKKNHLKQDDIANLLGVVRSTYGNYEQGTREMDLSGIIKLADFYKVSLDYLFGRTDLPFHYESYPEDEIEFIERALSLYQEMKSKIT
jgi:transcriptional regulator with XRE-family HTH domain